jgi:hypothetical protein
MIKVPAAGPPQRDLKNAGSNGDIIKKAEAGSPKPEVEESRYAG